MPKVGKVAIEPSRGNLCDEMVILQIPNGQLNPRSLVVILPNLLRTHFSLIMTDHLVLPAWKEISLAHGIIHHPFSYNDKITNVLPVIQSKGKRGAVHHAVRIKRLKILLRNRGNPPLDTGVLLRHHLEK